MTDSYAVGQVWRFDAPKGFEDARLIIGAILTFAQHEPVICAAVTDAPMLDEKGKVKRMAIPFLPFSKSAFDQTVTSLEGQGEVPNFFHESYEKWKADKEGFGYLNVPFKGLLTSMVEDLMAHSRAPA